MFYLEKQHKETAEKSKRGVEKDVDVLRKKILSLANVKNDLYRIILILRP
jgi:hypothetical protein